jgi:hypothetical protein
MDPTVLALESAFGVTNIGQLYYLLGIQITFNHNLIELWVEACINKIIE